MVIIFSDYLIFYKIFLSLQVKWNVVISNNNGMYKYPHELLQGLWLRILGHWEIIGIKILLLAKKILKNRNWTFLVVRYFTWNLKLDSNILSMTVGFQLPVLLALLIKVTFFICTNWANLLCLIQNQVGQY